MLIRIFQVYLLLFGFAVGAQAVAQSFVIQQTNPTISHFEACKEADATFTKAIDGFNDSCGPFLKSSKADCNAIIKSCNECPSGIGKDLEGLTCVSVYQQSMCPQMAGKRLEQAKKDREKLDEKLDDLKDEISETEDEIKQASAELTDLINEYQQEKSDLESEFTDAKDDLEQAIKDNSKQIDEDLAANIEEINKELSISLSIGHEIQNAVISAGKDLKNAKTQAYSNCNQYALNKVEDYKQRRREAIASGRYKKSNILSLMRRDRRSFAKKDDARFKSYYNVCLARIAKPQIKTAIEAHGEALRIIEQKKAEYSQSLSRLKTKITSLNQKAKQTKDDLLQEYTKAVLKATTAFQKNSKLKTDQFARNQQQVHSQLQALERKRAEQEAAIQNASRAAAHLRELGSYLSDSGTSDDDSFKTGFSEAISSQHKVKRARRDVYVNCCTEGNTSNSGSHKTGGYEPYSKDGGSRINTQARSYCKKAKTGDDTINDEKSTRPARPGSSGTTSTGSGKANINPFVTKTKN